MTYWLLEDKDLDEDLAERVQEADFVVAHSTYHGTLTALADVVLPAPVWSEQEGTFSTLEGRQVAVRKACSMPPGLMAEKEVLARLTEKM
jgi:predicted molibdopterin-dependent oxidoreductase YjgC